MPARRGEKSKKKNNNTKSAKSLHLEQIMNIAQDVSSLNESQ
jgi:hypothetical protein